uniref:Group II intron reverse transcriptase/maturase mat6 n=1 Tax=Eutreptiella sp. CCMP389 TaxID=96781 RepID=A0A977PJD4_9EUGL|nr:putative group II intron reverse transcriptase/maturase mat6 [Eutreptiella sp. CCMP389]
MVQGKICFDSWEKIDWNIVNFVVRSLRTLIFKARKREDFKNVIRWQSILLRSNANILYSICKVASRGNISWPIFRVDSFSMEKKFWYLFLYLSGLNFKDWLIIIKFANDFRFNSIFSLRGLVVQRMVNNALEPEWDAFFDSRLFFLKPKNSFHDALSSIFFLLANQNNRIWFLKASLEVHFYDLSSDISYFKNTFNSFPAYKLVLFWIKSNSLKMFDFSEKNFFEISIRSFLEKTNIFLLLINIFLFRLEEELNIIFRCELSFVRYGTNFLIFSSLKMFCEIAYYKVSSWLKNNSNLFFVRGNVFKIKNSVEFLGYTIKILGNFCFITPCPNLIKQIKKRLKEIWFQNLNSSVSFMICYFNSIIRDWIKYFRGFLTNSVLSKLDSFIWNRNLRYLKRKNPSKSYNWIYDRYFFVLRNSRKKRLSHFIQGTNIFLLKFSDFKSLRYFFVKDILFSKLLYPRFMLRKNFVSGKKIFRRGSLPFSQRFFICPLCFRLLRDKSLLTFFVSNLFYESTSDILLLHQRCYLKIVLFRFPKQFIKLRLFSFLTRQRNKKFFL